jgi:hypothetical protein
MVSEELNTVSKISFGYVTNPWLNRPTLAINYVYIYILYIYIQIQPAAASDRITLWKIDISLM